MVRRRGEAIILHLALEFENHDAWFGGPFVQALTYLTEGLLQPDLEFEHTWYRSGPYSCLVRNLLSGLRAGGYMRWDPEPCASGPTHLCTGLGRELLKMSLESGIRVKTEHLVQTFLSDANRPRLRLARALFFERENPKDALARLAAQERVAEEDLSGTFALLEQLERSGCQPEVFA